MFCNFDIEINLEHIEKKAWNALIFLVILQCD